MCETCTKQVSILALEREKIMSSAWNSAKTDNCDVDVVEEESYFTGASAHILIGEIMVCNRDLELIKTSMMLKKKMKNIIDVFRQNLKHTKIVPFSLCTF
ncbi:hypothetical protein AB205_0114940 [Aquarana catesbeiana]|uniref:Uncharacterized protein n=1 Tax=Aquarana catesbeiana TaxID=8400 RepID=A0A2G9QE98_AQUCT|nr:hypothetical protein AB205_0114940 [Aquarana catesbeiana]